jgi:hypothetical protein
VRDFFHPQRTIIAMTTITPAPRKNGNGTPPVPPVPEVELPEHRQKTVEAGLATYQKVLADRDELDGKLSEACKTIAGLTTQLDALKGVVNMMESTYTTTKLQMEERVTECQAVRDMAVSRAAGLEATLHNIMAVIRNSVELEPQQ